MERLYITDKGLFHIQYHVSRFGPCKMDVSTYWVSETVPPSQWYLAGTVFHCLARATIAPASKTPNPNRWLNSSPTPFMVQWKRPLASNKELRFDVRTVKCWMSLHVSWGLETHTAQSVTPAENSMGNLYNVFFPCFLPYSSLHQMMRRSRSLKPSPISNAHK